MNEYQQKIYDDLMQLVENNEAFYYVDQHIFDGLSSSIDTVYRIFLYRLASYTDFLNPSALECRGITFEVTEEGKNAQPIRLAAMPMEKFFNLHENPFTMDLDLSAVESVMLKADGSLISAFKHNGYLRLKTKGSLWSDQAMAAMGWLHDHENQPLLNEITLLVNHGFTVNMEWCAPDNRIVINYQEPKLVILNIRNNEDGSYVRYPDRVDEGFVEIHKHWIELEQPKDINEFVKQIPSMKDVEGYVVCISSGQPHAKTQLANGDCCIGIQHVKIKTEWYLTQHRAKDSIDSPRRLFEAVLEEATDDLKSLFHDNPYVLNKIDEMEKFVEVRYNHLVDTVERFYERNKGLERKEYAILGQQEMDRMQFGLAMMKYLDKPVSYKDAMKKAWKHYGLKDAVKEEE